MTNTLIVSLKTKVIRVKQSDTVLNFFKACVCSFFFVEPKYSVAYTEQSLVATTKIKNDSFSVKKKFSKPKSV